MRKLIIFIVLLALALLSSCIIAVVDSNAPEGLGSLRNEFRRTLPLKSGSWVTLKNGSGDIDIQGWDEEKIEIIAQERGPMPPPGIHVYGWIRRQPRIRVEAAADGVSIQSGNDPGELEIQALRYSLRVPKSVELKDIRNGQGNISISDIYGRIVIRQEEGDVKIVNFSGSIETDLKSGNVEAEVLDLRPEDEVRITTRQGNILVSLEPEADVLLETHSPAGEVRNDFDFKKEGAAPRARLVLSTMKGDIGIKKVQ